MNYHKMALDVVSDETRQWKRIVVEIAKTNPKAVVMASEKIDDGWIAGSLELMRANEKIKAIKFCRLKTGMGLKEAKAAVEALI